MSADGPLEARMFMRGRKIVVLGASSGIGRGIAVRAIRAGADVVVVDPDAERLAAVVEQAPGGHPLAIDLSAEGAGEHLAGQVQAELEAVELFLVAPSAVPLSTTDSSGELPPSFGIDVQSHHRAVVALVRLLQAGALVAVALPEPATVPAGYRDLDGAGRASLTGLVERLRETYPWLRFTSLSAATPVQSLGGCPSSNGQVTPNATDNRTADRASRRHEEVCDVMWSTLAALLEAPTIELADMSLRPKTVSV